MFIILSVRALVVIFLRHDSWRLCWGIWFSKESQSQFSYFVLIFCFIFLAFLQRILLFISYVLYLLLSYICYMVSICYWYWYCCLTSNLSQVEIFSCRVHDYGNRVQNLGVNGCLVLAMRCISCNRHESLTQNRSS